MKKVINERYHEIEGIKRPIFPCVEIEIIDDILIKMKSNFFIHNESEDKEKTDVYISLLVKEYRVYDKENINIALEEFTTDFLLEGIKHIRWFKYSSSTIDYQGNPVIKFVDSVDNKGFMELFKYI